MLLVIECIIACAVFAAVVLPGQYKDPTKYIMSYPPEIRKRVESLPQYKNDTGGMSFDGMDKGND